MAPTNDNGNNSFKPEPVLSIDYEAMFAPKTTAVDGVGMWRSWKRVFKKPESACLDLLDNSFDAALLGKQQQQPNSSSSVVGRVILEEFPAVTNSFLIQNNSLRRIKKLRDALTVFRSEKNHQHHLIDLTDNNNNNNKHDIGENGVGLKQGCAALSDCSVVCTRNGPHQVELGVIAQSLQSSQGVYLPVFGFEYETNNNNHSEAALEDWLHQNPDICHCLQTAFVKKQQQQQHDDTNLASVEVVVQTLMQLVRRLFTADWQAEEHVFLLLLSNIQTTTRGDGHKKQPLEHQLVRSVNHVQTFLARIQAMLPEHYINLPPNFDLQVNHQKLNFNYWQHRLVELTRFQVPISLDTAFDHDLEDDTWDQPAGGDEKNNDTKYNLQVYCGFDAQRVEEDARERRGTSTLYYSIYSRTAGRLIRQERDARHMLGLGASGVDFCQGLTVLINDVDGQLPLTPTKDDLAWSEQKAGHVHRRNLLAWVGAVAQVYWKHHLQTFGEKGREKDSLKRRIQALAPVQNNLQQQQQAATAEPRVETNLQDADLSECQGMQWSRIKNKHSLQHWIRKKNGSKYTVVKGKDTLFCLQKERKPNNRRRGSAQSRTNGATSDNNNQREVAVPLLTNTTSLVGGEIETYPAPDSSGTWPEVDPKDMVRLTEGVLAYMRDLDTNQLFAIPVVEALPTLRNDYLATVTNPMDFRTIEQDRMTNYTSTAELQKDLKLIFENCILFNGDTSDYGVIARKMMDALDEAFQSTVSGGKRSRKKRVRYDEEQDDFLAWAGNSTRVSYKRKKTTSTELVTTGSLKKQLKTERGKVKDLLKRIEARDDRIRELEALLPARALEQIARPPSPVPSSMKEEEDIPLPARKKEEEPEEGCQICGLDQHYESLLLCDGCDREFHTYCLDPPLSSVPNDSWYCEDCSSTKMPSRKAKEDTSDDGMEEVRVDMI